jgi:hypothetical protein
MRHRKIHDAYRIDHPRKKGQQPANMGIFGLMDENFPNPGQQKMYGPISLCRKHYIEIADL